MSYGLHPLVNRDLLELEPPQRLHALRALKRLRDGEVTADEVNVLEATHALLQLEGLRALRCGDALTSPLRIVFSQDGDDIEVVAVGLRQRSQVFQAAHYRLHPPAPPRRRMRTHTAADWTTKGMIT